MAQAGRLEGAVALERLSPQFFDGLNRTNSRLAQPVTPLEVLSALRMCADLDNGSCVLLQPGWSGYAWSDRKIPLVFMSHRGGFITARIRRGRSYRNGGATPATWPELRGFPRGASTEKVETWCRAADAVHFTVQDARSQSVHQSNCSISKWVPQHDGSFAEVA
jgi:hypothetical protein